MTDEEKAEEYVRTLRVAGINSYNHCNVEKAYLDGLAEGRKKEADLIFESWCKGSDDEQCECGFLKKLEKENAELRKEKWHDLRKNPNDFPKEEYAYHSITVLNQEGFNVKYDFIFGDWYFLNGDTAEVVAWCELPKFEE